MPHSVVPLPPTTWGDLEAIFDDLAVNTAERNAAYQLLQLTRRMAPHLSTLDLMREIFCIALVLSPENDRPPDRPRATGPTTGSGEC